MTSIKNLNYTLKLQSQLLEIIFSSAEVVDFPDFSCGGVFDLSFYTSCIECCLLWVLKWSRMLSLN